MTRLDHWRILLIDDDEDDYLITRAMLAEVRGDDVSLEWAPSYEAGERLLGESSFDAVLVDYDLGRRSGVDLIRALGSQDFPSPLILLTGRGGLEVDVEAMQAGAALYIAKRDVTPLLLVRSIRYAIDQKSTLQALQVSEDRWRQLAESMPGIVFSALPNGDLDYLCPQWTTYTGVPDADHLGVRWLECLHPADLPEMEEIWKRMGVETDPIEYEYRLRGKDGEYRWFKTRIVPVVLHGRLHRWYGSSTDVEDFKRNEQALVLRNAELEAARRLAETQTARLQAVFEALPVGVAITDVTGNSVQVNRGYEQVWGEPRPLINSLDDYALYQAWWHESGIPLQTQDWASVQAVANGKPVVAQMIRIRRFDGVIADVINSAAPIYSPDGEIIGSAVVIQDISELTSAQNALRISEARYRSLFEAMNDALAMLEVVYDDRRHPVDYRFLETNSEFERILGLSKAELIGKNISNYPQAAVYLAEVQSLMAGGASKIEIYVKEQKKRLHVSVFSAEADRIGILLTDITLAGAADDSR